VLTAPSKNQIKIVIRNIVRNIAVIRLNFRFESSFLDFNSELSKNKKAILKKIKKTKVKKNSKIPNPSIEKNEST
jgi:hypothetical protein